ncbi:MAG: sugar ABC transporter ATP-binding protein, partial [Armatimonadota bacterium]|nr:sugar ABC transporter ATP-binding protein [Armatimonadota bacterium]
RKRFGATIALDGVDLSVDRGEVLALVGENGAGKSTLMKVLSGAYQPDEGQMRLAGQPYRPRNPLDARRAGVAMIYQELSLAPHLSVIENILLGVEPTRGPLLDLSLMRRKAAEAMAQVGHGDIPLDTPVARLSVAEQQLVEIARSVALGSRVLVLDEPTSSLTRKDIIRLFELVRRLKQDHAIIYISHFLEEVKELSDRFTVLRDGRSAGGGVTAEAAPEQIIALMVGRTVDDLYPRSPRTPGEVVLEVRDLSGVTKPQAATLQLRRGEVLGIAGLVGAGRTELLRAIFGLEAVRRGEVKVLAHTDSAPTASPAQRWEQGVGMVSEDRKTEGLALNLSITDNLTLTRLPPLLRPARLDQMAQQWADRLAVKRRSVRQNIGDLSGGNQQKVAITRLLYHDADVLLLDEPTRGIDVGSKAQIYRVIDELACNGKAVLMVSSYLPELLGICDRVAVMSRGVLGPARPVAETDEHQIMMEAIGSGEAP